MDTGNSLGLLICIFLMGNNVSHLLMDLLAKKCLSSFREASIKDFPQTNIKGVSVYHMTQTKRVYVPAYVHVYMVC
jgi:hypothetical protein